MTSPFLDLYDPLDIIGNGSFGIIRKVRRKSDGLIFARKELNFERMSERDRKQIVSEVNILKDLHHDHIVRYHDRHVDRDAGILYILMEYCGGGDLSTVIKQAVKLNRPIPEDTIWNYFMQILLALQHCHHPNTPGRTSGEADGKDRRPQILHRDLKPDNVFLDEANTVKLGDFGLSKALAQASFANTYVGTPYYMSPELMQEKAYDSKSDIWSLGCLIYELCALKPPFHEAKTHAELSIFIRNGRIPPLPRGYSQSLASVIKAMLSLNPAMRPSAVQLLQHERLELVFKVSETEKMLSAVKIHKATVLVKERELLARESVLAEQERQKDAEIAGLHEIIAQLQRTQPDIETAIKQAVAQREEELRVLVMKREGEVAAAMNRREAELLEAVRQRDRDTYEAWVAKEAEIRREVEQREEWAAKREEELQAEEERLDDVRRELEERVRAIEDVEGKGRKEKSPLEEVQNVLTPLASRPTPKANPRPLSFQPLVTPVSRPAAYEFMPSAMKGVVLTATGETLATPTPAELVNLFDKSPKVGLNFAKIFDFEEREDDEEGQGLGERHSPPPSPSQRKEKELRERDDASTSSSGSGSSSSTSTVAASVPQPSSSSSSAAAAPGAPPTRLRRPSIRSAASAGGRPPSVTRAATFAGTVSEPTSLATPSAASCSSSSDATSKPKSKPKPKPKPLPHPHLHSQPSSSSSAAAPTLQRAVTLPFPSTSNANPAPEYDLADEENLPSPFIKRVDKVRAAAAAVAAGRRRQSGSGGAGTTLRAVAAANAAGKRAAAAAVAASAAAAAGVGEGDARPALASARKASEEARKALLRA